MSSREQAFAVCVWTFREWMEVCWAFSSILPHLIFTSQITWAQSTEEFIDQSHNSGNNLVIFFSSLAILVIRAQLPGWWVRWGLQLCLAGRTAVFTCPLGGEVSLGVEFQLQLLLGWQHEWGQWRMGEAVFTCLCREARKRLFRETRQHGGRQIESDIVQGALQGEHQKRFWEKLRNRTEGQICR